MKHVLNDGYLVLLGLLSAYGCYRYYLVWLYYRVKAKRSRAPEMIGPWPAVTIQIPVYNERYVVERAIRSACEVDYPAECLEVQILDDSTDDTSAIVARTLDTFRQRGFRVAHLRRAERRGFKAGALAESLPQARGEFLAVFDVDFVIPREFLKATVPFFLNQAVGMVQARWGHVNAEYSLLTTVQAIFLDGHFAIEQVARHQAGRFFSFNGTAGIWRKAAIVSSGSWQTDTLTEDLDLSYRAQLAGWRCIFLPDLVAVAELPVEMNALKAQQYRWTKGSIQTAKKLLPRILTSRVGWPSKAHAALHLASFFIYPVGFLASVGMPLVLFGLVRLPHTALLDVVWLLLLAVPGVGFYVCSQRELYANWSRRLVAIPWAVAMGVGLSFQHTLAVLDGLVGRTTAFVRTPKFCIQEKADDWSQKAYRAPRVLSAWVELVLAAYFAAGGIVALEQRKGFAVLWSLLFCAGFAYVGGLSQWQGGWLSTWRLQSARAQPSELQA